MPKRRAPKGCYWRHNILWGRVTVRGEDVRFSLRTSDAKTAERRFGEERSRLIAQTHFGDARMPYDGAFAEWSGHIVAQVGPATVKRYAVSLRQIAYKLRPLNVDEIDKAIVSEIVTERRGLGASNATIRRDLTALSSVLEFAEDQGWREGNPALHRLRRLKERRDPIVLPELDDIHYVIARAPGNFAAMIESAWLAGCRQGELVTALRTRLHHGLKQFTVIGKGNKLRVIQLSDAAYARMASVPASLSAPWLFWHSDGLPYRNVASRFTALVRAAQKAAQSEGCGFRPFRFHDLRHRYAVDELKAGRSIYDLQGHLGHTSVKTTEMYLAYLTTEEAARAKAAPTAQNPAQRERFSA